MTDAEPFPKNVQDVNGTLHFNNVRRQDGGQYTCIANNSQGEISVVIDVDIVGMCISSVALKFDEGTRVGEDSTSYLFCNVRSRAEIRRPAKESDRRLRRLSLVNELQRGRRSASYHSVGQ